MKAGLLGLVLGYHSEGLVGLTLSSGEVGFAIVLAGHTKLGESISFGSYTGLAPFGSHMGCMYSARRLDENPRGLTPRSIDMSL